MQNKAITVCCLHISRLKKEEKRAKIEISPLPFKRGTIFGGKVGCWCDVVGIGCICTLCYKEAVDSLGRETQNRNNINLEDILSKTFYCYRKWLVFYWQPCLNGSFYRVTV